MLNRGAVVPIALFFICTVVLVLAAFASYAFFEKSRQEGVVNAFDAQNELLFKQRYTQAVFEDSVKHSIGSAGDQLSSNFCALWKDVVLGRDTKNLDFGTFFSTVRNYDCVLVVQDGSYVLTVPQFTIQVESGANVINQTLTFEARFNETGVQYIYK